MTCEKVNIVIGRQIASRRRQLGMSLSRVSAECGVSLQQIHKYEAGQSGVSAAMLVRLSSCLDVPVGFFFQPLQVGGAPSDPRLRPPGPAPPGSGSPRPPPAAGAG